ncbi:MAG: hypothetical protein ACUVRM_09905 [Bacillota bacterium]
MRRVLAVLLGCCMLLVWNGKALGADGPMSSGCLNTSGFNLEFTFVDNLFGLGEWLAGSSFSERLRKNEILLSYLTLKGSGALSLPVGTFGGGEWGLAGEGIILVSADGETALFLHNFLNGWQPVDREFYEIAITAENYTRVGLYWTYKKEGPYFAAALRFDAFLCPVYGREEVLGQGILSPGSGGKPETEVHANYARVWNDRGAPPGLGAALALEGIFGGESGRMLYFRLDNSPGMVYFPHLREDNGWIEAFPDEGETELHIEGIENDASGWMRLPLNLSLVAVLPFVHGKVELGWTCFGKVEDIAMAYVYAMGGGKGEVVLGYSVGSAAARLGYGWGEGRILFLLRQKVLGFSIQL